MIGGSSASRRRGVAARVRHLRLVVPDPVLEVLVHPLVGERLAGDVRGAVGLAAAALGAASRVEALLPGQVRDGLGAELLLLEIRRGQLACSASSCLKKTLGRPVMTWKCFPSGRKFRNVRMIVRCIQNIAAPSAQTRALGQRREQHRHRRGDRLPRREAAAAAARGASAPKMYSVTISPPMKPRMRIRLPGAGQPVGLHRCAQPEEVGDARAARRARPGPWPAGRRRRPLDSGRVRGPERVGGRGEHLERVDENPIANSIRVRMASTMNAAKMRTCIRPGAALLRVHHALLAEAEAEQRAGTLAQVVEPVLRLHGQQDGDAPVHDVDEDGEPDEDQQAGDEGIHGRPDPRVNLRERPPMLGNAGDGSRASAGRRGGAPGEKPAASHEAST